MVTVYDESVIPKGDYCYSGYGSTFKCCPYWSSILKQDEDDNEYTVGKCSFINKDDDELGGGLLWDQVKSCNINGYTDEEMDQLIEGEYRCK